MFNQLGDEIGFPKNLVKEGLLEKDKELMIKNSFTFNILVCGKPGVGKSTFINRIMGEEKCFSGKGTYIIFYTKSSKIYFLEISYSYI